MAQGGGHSQSGVIFDFEPSRCQSGVDPSADTRTRAMPCAAAGGERVRDLYERWRRLTGVHHSSPWPHPESRDVVDAVLDVLANGPEVRLHDAGRRWGAAHRDTESLAERIDLLRQILVEEWKKDSEDVHRALDGVQASAAMALSRRLEIDSRTDVLTGAGNRRAFDESLAEAIASASRQGYSVALVMIDIDAMKEINDSKGHQAGDDALVALAHGLDTSLRREDHVYRLGGDEFAVIMPYCAAEQVAGFMERIRRGGAPSFSWGVSSYPAQGVGPSALLAAADASMYRRKSRSERRSSQRARSASAQEKVRSA